MRRRPTAEDRTLADVFRRLQPGRYDLVVDEPSTIAAPFVGLARLKCEGATSIEIPDGKLIDIVPQREV